MSKKYIGAPVAALFCSVLLCASEAHAEFYSAWSDSFSSMATVARVRHKSFSPGWGVAQGSVANVSEFPDDFSIGDEFAGFGVQDTTERLYFGQGDVFDSWQPDWESNSLAFARHGDEARKETLIVGKSFPLEKSWTSYFAGKRKSPPLVALQILEPVPEYISGGDSFSSSGWDTFSTGSRECNCHKSGKSRGKLRPWRPAPPAGELPEPGNADAEPAGQSAKAGVLGEPRWSLTHLPLRVYISGVVSEARDGLIAREIISSLRDWRDASKGKVRFILTDRYVDADVLFVCESTVEHQWAENITSYHKSMYDRVKVRLLDETLYKLDAKRVRAVCLHEVGHVFGIRNHSGDKRDAMSLSATDDFRPIQALTGNDKRLIAKLYP